MIISSFYLPFLQAIREQQARHTIECPIECPIGYLVFNFEARHVQEARDIDAVSMHVNKDSFLRVSEAEAQERVALIQSAGLDIYVYTVNTAEEAKTLFDAGIDGIFTDYPQRFIHGDSYGCQGRWS